MQFGAGGKGGGPTTKFGRKVSRPKTFVPTNKPTSECPRVLYSQKWKRINTWIILTVHRRKRAAAPSQLDANLMCEVCRAGHSPAENRVSSALSALNVRAR